VLVENEVAVMPDLCFTFTNMLMWDSLDNVWGDPEFPYLQPDTASMWQAGNINRRDNLDNFVVRGQWKLALMQKLTVAFQNAGILQVIGTDASLPGLFPGKAVHRELTELVKAGISNYDAVAIATSNAGRFIQRYIDHNAQIGQVQPGYRADLVILNDNPLDDVRNARDIDAIVVNGRYISSAELQERRNELRARYAVVNSVNAEIDAALLTPQANTLVRTLVRSHRDDAGILKSIENRINAAGYAAAFADELDRSERILELNTTLFPQSANTWDSLAELVLYRGDSDGALALYRKALAADPTFPGAAENIERILKNAN
jgi:hypothetical protein